MNGWDYLLAHPSSSSNLPDLQAVTAEVFEEMRRLCGIPSTTLDVQYDDGTIGDAPILAYARRTMFLKNDVWTPGVLSYPSLGEIVIRVNPNVPNGWFVDDGACRIGYQYDLKTVLRHELLHGFGLASSVTATGMGYVQNGECHPTLFDAVMQDAHGESATHECSLLVDRSAPVFVGGVQLYTPEEHQPGSSYSHHAGGGLLNAAIQPRQCLYVEQRQVDMLRSIGIECHRVYASEAGTGSFLPIFILVFIVTTCLVRRT